VRFEPSQITAKDFASWVKEAKDDDTRGLHHRRSLSKTRHQQQKQQRLILDSRVAERSRLIRALVEKFDGDLRVEVEVFFVIYSEWMNG
jgi:hypothetical protein